MRNKEHAFFQVDLGLKSVWVGNMSKRSYLFKFNVLKFI